MDGAPGPTPKAGSGVKAVVPAGIDAGVATSSARGARKATLPGGAAAAASDAPAAPAMAAPGAVSNGGSEEDDDEQVERFYALLDNIRALRGAYGSGSGDGAGGLDGGVVDTATGGGGTRAKRLRGSEPPWRPAFRLEDFQFQEPTPTSSSSSDAAPCAKRTRGQVAEADGEGSGGARPEVDAVGRVRLDSGRKSV